MRFALGLLSSIFVIEIVFAQTITPNQLNLDLLSTTGTITISGPVGPSYFSPALPSWLSFSGCDPTNFSNTCVFTVTADPAKITSYPASYSFVICSQLGTCTTKSGTITYTNSMPITLSPTVPQTLNPSSTQTSAVTLAYNPSSSGSFPASVELSLQKLLPSWLAWDSVAGNNSCSNPITLNANSSCQVILKVNGKSITQNDSYTLNYCLKKNSNICTSNPVTFTIDPFETFTISGQISGLDKDKSFILKEEITSSSTPSPQSQQITITQNGAFKFTQGVSPESQYVISVDSQPEGQPCSVVNSTGKVTNANITDVFVQCSNSVGGTVTGLDTGESVTLQLNKLDDKIQVNGETEKTKSFTFPTNLSNGSEYEVTTTATPIGKTCTIAHGKGTITSNITTVEVNCSINTYSVGGTVTGLDTGDSVTLQLNSSDNTIQVNGETEKIKSFTFPKEISYNSQCTVTTSDLTGYTCTVSNSPNKIIASVIDIKVNCSKKSYSVGGNVTGLDTGESVTLQLNGSNNTKTVTANGQFTFPKEISYKSDYKVTTTNPSGKYCMVEGSGTGIAQDVINIAVNCYYLPISIDATPRLQVLSVSGHTEYGIFAAGSQTPLSSGVARTITITNKGDYKTSHFSVQFPSTTGYSGCKSGELEANGSCIITITPGSTPSNDNLSNPCSTGVVPQPSNILVTWEPDQSLTIPVYILDYGCIYEGGYVFALDDSSPANEPIHGKVVSISNIVPQGSWLPTNKLFCGISEKSTPSDPDPANQCSLAEGLYCNGKTDGQCNTAVITTVLKTDTTNTANQCNQYDFNGLGGWYLPAICELGYNSDATSNNFCNSASDNKLPLMQNIYSNVYAKFTSSPDWSALYWSSTQKDNQNIWVLGNKSFNDAHQPPVILSLPRSLTGTTAGAVRCVRQF